MVIRYKGAGGVQGELPAEVEVFVVSAGALLKTSSSAELVTDKTDRLRACPTIKLVAKTMALINMFRFMSFPLAAVL